MATSQTIALLRKDLLTTSRRWHELASLAIVSSLIGLVVAYIVSGPLALLASQLDAPLVIVAGEVATLFIVAIAAGFIAVVREAEKGTLDGLRASPVAPESLFLAKLVYIYIVVVVLLLFYIGAAVFFSSITIILNPMFLAASLVVGLYFAAAAALTSFMIVYSEARSLLSMIVLAGLLVPFAQSADRVLAKTATGIAGPGEVLQALGMTLAFIVIATLLSRPLSEI
ncbi:hypothetical protein PYJP_05520 [Pyrofollis japonicus]|uniref:hypothetical protein n=1 Tax=Pyrofollis japonicus TaxID=3060460 RepID=UPI00295C0A0C|nr:hypothetical protein [Pyrofollis japonicus]BEP17200.1 hypothetical protein PYJP_05520 [Pyrofollis japonicus]